MKPSLIQISIVGTVDYIALHIPQLHRRKNEEDIAILTQKSKNIRT